MKIIKKIEIVHFRSFIGSTKDTKAEVFDVKDLNIFSGSNDSGKSNILRALNLFFNDEIDSTHQFSFDTEFNMEKREFIQKVIEIKITFSVNKKEFSISKFYDISGYRNFEYEFTENDEKIIIDSRPEANARRYGSDGKFPNQVILRKERDYRRSATRFLSFISFSYVPAIRDERFFSHLYGKVILQIKTNEERQIENLNIEKRKIQRYGRTLLNTSEKPEFLRNLRNKNWREERIKEIDDEIEVKSEIRQAISELEKQINKFSRNLFSSAEFLVSEFRIGSNLKEFFESFDIGTGERKDISLRLRGDGIQAKFIPEMLEFLDSLLTSKKYFVWGFEEPENSSEYKNQQELAEKFKEKFAEKKQIFLTTHSEEFLSLYDGADIEKEKRRANLYHVKKIKNKEFDDFSVIDLFDVETQSFEFANVKSNIEQDIGTSLIRAKYSKDLIERENSFLKEKEAKEKEFQLLEQDFKQQIEGLRNNLPERIFICEDELGISVWESFFEKVGITDFKIISSKGCTVNNVEIWINGNRKQNPEYNPKVFRSLDRDGYTDAQIQLLEEKLKKRNGEDLEIENYKIQFLPVNELENFAVIKDNYFTDEIIDNHKNDLEDHFISTADANVRHNHKLLSEVFRFNESGTIANQMKREAETDIKRLFPGKEIKKLKQNFNIHRFLTQLLEDDFPEDLISYLEEVKQFFQD